MAKHFPKHTVNALIIFDLRAPLYSQKKIKTKKLNPKDDGIWEDIRNQTHKILSVCWRRLRKIEDGCPKYCMVISGAGFVFFFIEFLFFFVLGGWVLSDPQTKTKNNWLRLFFSSSFLGPVTNQRWGGGKLKLKIKKMIRAERIFFEQRSSFFPMKKRDYRKIGKHGLYWGIFFRQK